MQKHLERKSVMVAHYSTYCIMLMVHFIVLNLFSLQMQGEIIFKALSFESHHLLSKLNSKFNFCYTIPIAADTCLELCLVASHFRKIGIQGWKKLKFDFFWCSSQGLLLPYPIFFDQFRNLWSPVCPGETDWPFCIFGLIKNNTETETVT